MAIALAREQNAQLTGLAISDLGAAVASVAGGLASAGAGETTAYLEGFARTCRSAGLSARLITRVGHPADIILDEMSNYDVTVIGREASFVTAGGDGSSIRDRILRGARRLVLLVPAESAAAPGLGKSVLVAYDGSAPSEHALDSFMRSGLPAKRDIHVVTVGDDGEKAWDVATHAVEKLQSFGVRAVTHNLVSRLRESEALLELGREIGAGLVVMGAFAHSRLTELIHGSGTREVVAHSPVPICLQH
jgi:nucleotide-binding universal stress UspA family protein